MTNTTLRAALTIGAVLSLALVVTGFVSSAYEKERTKLGDRHFTAGQRLMTVQDLTGATEEFRKALLFAPDRQEYRLSLATALLTSGKLDEAESHLEQLAQEDPTNGHINLLLARVALRERRTSQALESYQRAVYEYWPADEWWRRRQARWEFIRLLEQVGNRRNQLVGELLQLYGNLPPGLPQRVLVGQALLLNGADAEAAHIFRDILQAKPAQYSPESLAAHLGLARVAYRTGDFVEARHEYQRAARDNPTNAEAAAALREVNDIIDLAPELPNISAAERLRRSRNLLSRVQSDLRDCGSPAAPEILDERLRSVQAEIAHAVRDQNDEADALQKSAQDLWKDRAVFCRDVNRGDAALEAVLPRLGLE